MTSDCCSNVRTNARRFSDLVSSAVDRRTFWQVAASSTCGAFLAEASVSQRSRAPLSTMLFQFDNVPVSEFDQVVVPTGYVAEVLYRWGDPINGQSPPFRSDGSNTAEEQALQAGMGHDGMEFFAIPGADPNQRGLLAINHEYTDQVLLFKDGLAPLPPAPLPFEKVLKSQHAHGVSIVEIQRQTNGVWHVVESPFARRITTRTPMQLSGPAVFKVGTSVAGTVNNCAAGRTPWGTYLTCEENFQGVFGSTQDNFVPSPAMQRYGFTKSGYIYPLEGQDVPAFRWYEHDRRFDLADPGNDSDRFGFVVEIDPLDPTAIPIKRTALGRFKHENAALVVSRDRRIVVYMGDDERDEYIYKFVSSEALPAGQTLDRGTCGPLLDRGILYVAKFQDDGNGEWVPLVPGQNGIPARSSDDDRSGFDEADICIRTREAADLAGATPMDRPEWVAVNPETNEVFVSLTNNTMRGQSHPVDAANPREKNIFGHIVRWNEEGGDPAATRFRWRVFVLAGNPQHPTLTRHGNVAGDPFGCPDGLRFDPSGILWIQTDMSAKYMGTRDFKELGHNMMLAADPNTGEVRRFLTGPRGCEITGMAMTPDRRTMFVNIQHPGEPHDDASDVADPDRYSHWPDGPTGGRPRSATVAIRRLDGETIGR